VLVGGMALVVLGSRRVTRDFDSVIAHPGDRLARLIKILYDRGFELVSSLNDIGEVTSTIANRRVAAIRLRLDAPTRHTSSTRRQAFVSIFCSTSRFQRLSSPSMQREQRFARMCLTSPPSPTSCVSKRIARTQRSAPGDAEDIAFLKARGKSSPARRTSRPR
jgi:hypothetical protein